MPRPKKKRDETVTVEDDEKSTSRPDKDKEEEGSKTTHIIKGPKGSENKSGTDQKLKKASDKVNKKGEDDSPKQSGEKRPRKGLLKEKSKEPEEENGKPKKKPKPGTEDKPGKKSEKRKEDNEEDDSEERQKAPSPYPGKRKRKATWKIQMDKPAPAVIKRKRKALLEKYEQEIEALPEKRKRKVTWKLLQDFEFFDTRKSFKLSEDEEEEEEEEEKSEKADEKPSTDESEEEEETEKKKTPSKRRRKSSETEEESDGKTESGRKRKKVKKGTGTSCSILICSNYHGATHGSDISYYKFPKDPKLKDEWVKRCGRDEEWNIKFPRVCSEHFSEDQFEDDIRARIMGEKPRKKLKPDAIPNRRLRRTPSPEKEPEIDTNQQKILEEESRKKFIEQILKEYEEKQREEEAKEKAKDAIPMKGVVIGPDVRILTEAEIKKRIADGAFRKTTKTSKPLPQNDDFGGDRCGDIIEVTEVMMNEDEVVEVTSETPGNPQEEEDLSGCERCDGINVKFIVEDHKLLKGQVQTLKQDLKDKDKECDELKLKLERIESLVAILCTQIPEEQEPVKFSYYEGRRALFLNQDSNGKSVGPKTEIRLC